MTRGELEALGRRWMDAMRRGDFESAWRETDRIEIPRRASEAAGSFVRGDEHLVWNGAPFDGTRVLVRCSHGLGDTLQFVRFAPLIRGRARALTVLAQPMLVELLRTNPDLGDVRNGWTDTPPPPHDVEIEVMELAYAFRSTPATLPRAVPYLGVDEIRRRAPKLPPIARDAVNVGVLWSASEWDKSRSVPLEALAPLARIPGVRFYSLQQGTDARDVDAAPFPIEPYSRHTTDILAAARAMLDLDLVITVDSMAAHLAGALARPVWVMLLHEADWRWMRSTDVSPWYPTMRLFRQPRAGDWGSVVRALTKALEALAATRARSPA